MSQLIKKNMLKKINIVPRWIIFLLDIAVAGFSFLLAFLVKQNLALTGVSWESVASTLFLLFITNSLVFTSIKTYAGIVRYTGMQDAIRIAISIFVSSALLFLFSKLSYNYRDAFILDNVIIILYASFSFLSMLSYRMGVKFLFAYAKNYKMVKKNVVIFGAGEAGVATKRVLEHDTQNNISLLAFIDDDRKKNNKVLDGIPIINFSELGDLVKTQQVDELVIASFTITPQRKNDIVDFCLDHDIKVLNVPAYNKWTEGKFNSKQLQNVKIEDLLERDPIVINNNQIRTQIKGKRVLVTGAAGSIGSEIVRQLMNYAPELIVLCDQAETPLHSLELELQEKKHHVNCIPYLADITNEQRMEDLFNQFKPHYVYHAAAYKHVPMMELCPSEAVKNNVLGTRLMADLAVKHYVDRFVMVSTDKAVNPTNVMGASKRLAEIYVQGLSKEIANSTKFITTRFGNVLGSNGSVINRFKEQIEKGGPVTVTHPEILRYFMTIPEACSLVLEAVTMGGGSEIFIFDMGEPVKIIDLAKKMIRLSGLVPGKDINIIFTGLRPGEKLYEELLNKTEHVRPTHNKKILIAGVIDYDYYEISKVIDDLIYKAVRNKDEEVVRKMKSILPEFISNNSTDFSF